MKYRIFYANHYWWRLTLIRPDGESASVVAAQSPSGRHLTFDGFGVIGRIPRGLSAMLLLLDHTEAPFNRV
ncbi:hypothetical protein, partial [Shewanella algae]|uniref:hypothetical protein n=1 Tax=Shewanella algae TaxID=38313 RepID=UPI00313F191A